MAIPASGRRRLLLIGTGQIVILVLLAIVAILLWNQFESDRQLRIRLHQSYEARSQIQRVLSLLQDAETGQRGYVITGDRHFLEPYLESIVAIPEQLQRLDALLRPDAAQMAQLRRLEDLVAQKQTSLARPISLRQQGDSEAAQRWIASGVGNRIMESIRELAAAMLESEARQVAAASADEIAAERRARVLALLLLVGVALFTTTAAISTVILLGRRRQALAALGRQEHLTAFLRDVAEHANQATFDAALDATLGLLVERTNAAWGMSLRLEQRADGSVWRARWAKDAEGLDRAAAEAVLQEWIAQMQEPTVLVLPEEVRAPGVPDRCVVYPVGEGAQIAGALVVAERDSQTYETARSYVTRQLARAAERQRILDALQETLARQEALFTCASEGIITVNESGGIEGFNPAAKRLFGYDAAEILHRPADLLLDEGSSGEADLVRRLAAAAETQSRAPIEATGRRRDGSTFPVEIGIGVMDLERRRLFVAFVRDISERKRVERMQSEFVSTVSHELRTPLTSIAGSLGLVAGGAAGPIGERAGRLVEIARNNTKRLVRLVNDILDIERLQSGRTTFDFSLVPLGEMVDQTISANRGYAESYGVSVEKVDAAPDAVVRADPDRLNQALTNLLSNAIKFSPTGGSVTVRISGHGEAWRVSVEDRGPGIPEAFRPRVFERFAQADASDSRQKGGSGLGLGIAREIVQRHGGTISFETEEGRGTIFHIDLPRAQHEAAPVRPPRRDASPGVLVLASDPDIADRLAGFLARHGLRCTSVHSKEAAGRALEGDAFDVVLVDVPGGAAAEPLVRFLRERLDGRARPVILLSAEPGSGDSIEVSRPVPIIDILGKPPQMQRLLDDVRAALGRSDAAKPCILHVEDDSDVLEVVRQTLDGAYAVVPAVSLEEARRALAAHDFDLVILDLTLADGLGRELLPQLVDRDGVPLPTIIFTAQDPDPGLAAQVDSILTKSRGTIDQLVEAVRGLIDRTAEKRHGAAG